MRRPRSILDGFFTDDVDAVAAAARALRGEGDYAPSDVSYGRVYSTGVLFAHQTDARGILSEAIFGPILSLRCACGALDGEENRDQVCERCGVLCADASLRDWRFGHVEIAGAVHPLLIGAVARALDLEPARVRSLVNPGDEGIDFADDEKPRAGYLLVEEALRAHGASDALLEGAIVRRVPLPPPGDRPIIEPLSPTMVDPFLGPLNEAWLELIDRANRHARLVALAAPEIIQVGEAFWIQLALERVIDLTRARPLGH